MNKYQELMENIEVDDAMKERALLRLHRQKRRTMPKWVPVLAMGVMVLLVLIPTVFTPMGSTSSESAMAVTDSSPLQDFATLQELEESIGFPVEEWKDPGFDVTQTSYVSLFGEIAEVVYTGDSQTLTLRKGQGEDISGDYRSYTEEKELVVNDISVILLGNDGLYANASWKKNGYTYVIMTDHEIQEEEMMQYVMQIL